MARLSLSAAMAAGAAIACGQILGVDAYSVGDPTGSAGSSGTADAGAKELPILPAIPDAAKIESCTACVAEKCADKRQVCLASERCRDMLACMGDNRCRDPNCIARCQDTHPWSSYFQDYFNCAFQAPTETLVTPTVTRCLDECAAGTNFDCMGDYVWDTESPELAELNVQVYNSRIGEAAAIGPGYEITACVDNPDPVAPPGDAGCDEWREVGLHGDAVVPFSAGDFVRIRADAFALRDLPHGDRARLYGRPILRSGFVALPNTAIINIFYGNQGIPYDPNLGFITAVQTDCLGSDSAADIELADASPSAVRRCIHSGKIDDCTTPRTVVTITGVPPAWNTRLKSARPDGTLITERSVLTAARWRTVVGLHPPDKNGR